VILVVPDKTAGCISQIAGPDRHIAVGYGERLIVLETSGAARKENMAKNSVPEARGVEFVSSMDGLFYLSASPNDPPFVQVGDVVVPGQTLGLIEVMKCFYPIKFQGNKSARVVKIIAKNAIPVTSGMPLFLLAMV
jgi:biotin carboxyl carrier protein